MATAERITRARAVPISNDDEVETVAPLYFLTVPLETYQLLSKAALARGMTLAQALSTAVTDFLDKKV